MDNDLGQPQGSISSISTTNVLPNLHGGPDNANPTAGYVNHGLLLWNQTRRRWVGSKRHDNRAHQDPKLNTHCLCVPKSFWQCSWNVTYDNLLESSKPFPRPIPLGEMVDFLVDIWEEVMHD